MWADLYRHFIKTIEILKEFHIGFIMEIVINIAIFCIICKIVDVFEKSLSNKLRSTDKDSPASRIVTAITKILKCVVFFIMFAGFLQTHGYSVSSLIAGFGITGLAVGLAANTTLSNIFGTISIISDKSFKIGDYIKIGSHEGTVESISMRSTKIRTMENTLTIIPNSVIANTEVINVSACHKRRIFETFGVTYDTSNEKLEQAVKILENIFENDPDITNDYLVFVETLANSSINIKAHAYAKVKTWAKLSKAREKFILEAVKQFREAGIDFAFPSQTIYMAKDNNEN